MCVSQQIERSLEMHYFDVGQLNKSKQRGDSGMWESAAVVEDDGEMVPLLFGEA